MQWFYDLKTSTKLWAAFGVLTFLTVAVGLVGLTGLKAMDTMLNKIYEDQALAGGYLREVSGDVRAIGRFVRNAIAADAGETDKIDKEIAAIAKADDAVRKNLARLKPMVTSADGRTMFAALEKDYASWKITVDKATTLAVAQKDEETRPLVEEARAKGDAIEAALVKFTQQKNEDSENLKKEADALYARSWLWLVAMSVLAALIGAAISSRKRSGPRPPEWWSWFPRRRPGT